MQLCFKYFERKNKYVDELLCSALATRFVFEIFVCRKSLKIPKGQCRVWMYVRRFSSVLSSNFKLFDFPIFRFWAYLMEVIPETRRAYQFNICVFITTNHLISVSLTFNNYTSFENISLTDQTPIISSHYERDKPCITNLGNYVENVSFSLQWR